MKQLIASFLLLASLLFSPAVTFAAEEKASSSTDTPAGQVKVESAHEKKIRAIATVLRCPVCQGESVYDSQSPVAVEMKNLISDKIKAGQSADEILTYFKDRYGNFILMEPPAEGLHWVIWVFPLFMALLGALFLFQNLKAGAKELEQTHTPLDEGEITGTETSDVSDIRELRL